MRRIVVGDIHGNYEVLEMLLKEVNYTPKEDILVFVGDYIDHGGWQGNRRNVNKTLSLLVALVDEAPDTVFPIRGNHDQWMSDWLHNGGIPSDVWYTQGGMQTLASYADGVVPSKTSGYGEPYTGGTFERIRLDLIPEEHKRFLANLPLYYHDSYMLVVHGGLPLKKKEAQEVLRRINEGRHDFPQPWAFDIMWDRDWWHARPRMYQLFIEIMGKEKLFITGHTAGHRFANHEPFMSGPFVNEKTDGRWVNLDSEGLHLMVYDPKTDEFEIHGELIEETKARYALEQCRLSDNG